MSSQPPASDDPPTIPGSVGTYPPPQLPPPPQMPPPQIPPYMAPPAPPAPNRSDGGLAIAGLILALLSMACLITGIGLVIFRHAPGLTALIWFCGLPLGVVGIVLAAVGRSSARRQGSGTAGLIIATLAVVLTALFLLVGLAAARAGMGPGRLHPRQRLVPQGSGAPTIVRQHVPFVPFGPSR